MMVILYSSDSKCAIIQISLEGNSVVSCILHFNRDCYQRKIACKTIWWIWSGVSSQAQTCGLGKKWILMFRGWYGHIKNNWDCEGLVTHIFVSLTSRRRDINVLSVGPRAEDFDIVSNDHGRKPKCNFTATDRKYRFK